MERVYVVGAFQLKLKLFFVPGWLAFLLVIMYLLKSTSLYQSQRSWRLNTNLNKAITSFLFLEVSSSPFYLAQGLLGKFPHALPFYLAEGLLVHSLRDLLICIEFTPTRYTSWAVVESRWSIRDPFRTRRLSSNLYVIRPTPSFFYFSFFFSFSKLMVSDLNLPVGSVRQATSTPSVNLIDWSLLAPWFPVIHNHMHRSERSPDSK